MVSDVVGGHLEDGAAPLLLGLGRRGRGRGVGLLPSKEIRARVHGGTAAVQIRLQLVIQIQSIFPMCSFNLSLKS